MTTPPQPSQDLIFGGTGINYSWHLPRLFDLEIDKLEQYRNLVFVSGGSVALLVYWAMKKNLATWEREDFLNWNKHTRKVYKNNLLSGLTRVIKLKMGSKSPIYKNEDYHRAWAIATKPEFFDVKMKDLPSSVKIPLLNLQRDEIVLASRDSEFSDVPAYLVSFASTAIPRIFADVKIGKETWGDITYSRKHLVWLKEFESKSPRFTYYNMVKEGKFPNGEYVKICDHPEPKKMMNQDNMKFIFGRHIESYPANIRRTKL